LQIDNVFIIKSSIPPSAAKLQICRIKSMTDYLRPSILQRDIKLQTKFK